jgi:hypothetical protein
MVMRIAIEACIMHDADMQCVSGGMGSKCLPYKLLASKLLLASALQGVMGGTPSNIHI